MGRWGQYCIVPLSSSGCVYTGRQTAGQSKAWSLVWTVVHRQWIPIPGPWRAHRIQALNDSVSPWCSWGWTILQAQVLLGPCREVAWIGAFSLSYSTSHPKFVPDTGFTPNRLSLGQAGACERTWVRTQVPKEQWQAMRLGKCKERRGAKSHFKPGTEVWRRACVQESLSTSSQGFHWANERYCFSHKICPIYNIEPLGLYSTKSNKTLEIFTVI